MLSAGSDFTGREVVNPFSDAFTEKWNLWLQYKKEVHRFQYKHTFTEQAALNELVEFSGGDEEHAWRIMNRSMANNWKGFYKTHNPKNDKKDGNEKQSGSKNGTTASPEGLRAAFVKRTGTGG